MGELLEFRLADGSVVYVQGDTSPLATADVEADGEHVATRGWRDRAPAVAGTAIVAASSTFDQAVEAVRPAAELLIERLRAVAGGPDELSVEFGLQLSGQVGAYIAQASSTANFRVTLTWRK